MPSFSGSLSQDSSYSIALNGVAVRYPGQREPVVANLDLRVSPGERIALMGMTGSGKSTLLAAIGRVGNGVASGGIYTKHRPVLATQTPHLLSWRTAWQNLLLGIELSRPLTDADLELARDFVDRVGLRRVVDKLPAALSGGQRQLVALGSSLLTGGRVMLLDEPVSSLDWATKQRAYEAIDNWFSRLGGATLVLATHNPGEALGLANRVVFLAGRPGRIAEDIGLDDGWTERSLVTRLEGITA